MHPRTALLLGLAAACAPARAPQTAATPAMAAEVVRLRAVIDSMANAPEYRNAHWGILIVDPESGDTLYSRNAGKLFMPASNMKLVTGAVSLTQLGPDHRFTTSLSTRGRVHDGVIEGDVVVESTGDASVSDHMQKDAMVALRAIADSLAAAGVRRISGRLVPAPQPPFAGATLGYGWSWSDLEAPYSAPIADLLFNEGFSELVVRAGAQPGDPPTVQTRPAKTYPLVRVTATTVGATQRPPDDTSSRWRNTTRLDAVKDTAFGGVYLVGQIEAGDSAVVEVTHRDPREAYLAALTEALRERGIAVDGRIAPQLAPAGDSTITIATVQSPPLIEILTAMMKPSQNQIAEMLMRGVGLAKTGVGLPDSGRAVAARQLLEWGAPEGGFVLRDGSGLSRYNYLAPETIVKLLDAMRKSPHAQVFYESLPIAGVDGTIRTRMRGTPAEGNLRAKTGTIANSRALSGYVNTGNGRRLIFSIIANNFTAPVASVTRVQDAIGASLAALGSVAAR